MGKRRNSVLRSHSVTYGPAYVSDTPSTLVSRVVPDLWLVYERLLKELVTLGCGVIEK